MSVSAIQPPAHWPAPGPRPETCPEPEAPQRISVVMANYNGAAYLDAAIRSVLAQSHRDLELIISDDGSQDDSCRIVRAAMARDARVRLIEAAASGGPGAARNRALAAATGAWLAIIDSDDLVHPDRLRRLLRAALILGADMVADDQVFFSAPLLEPPRTLLQRCALRQPSWINPLSLIRAQMAGARGIQLGYLKPLIRRGVPGSLVYNESLRVDEDYDLYLRLMLAGARFAVIPDALYLYRRHPGSASHRYGVQALEHMIAAQRTILFQLPPGREAEARAICRRIRQHTRALRYARAIAALKAGSWAEAACRLIGDPRNWPALGRSLGERTQRWLWFRQAEPAGRLQVILCGPAGRPADIPAGHMVFEVPELTEFGWDPSAPQTWAELVRLDCIRDLEVVAHDEAGAFALGLLPRCRSARAAAGLLDTAADPRPAADRDAAHHCRKMTAEEA